MTFRSVSKVAVFAALMLTLMSRAADAQTVGTLMENTISSTSRLPWLLSALSYLSGITLAIMAIFKFKDHVDNSHQTKLSEGVKRLLAGGMFLSLPFMSTVTRNLLQHGNGPGFRLGNVDMTTTGGTTPGNLDDMVVMFIRDVYGPMTNLLTAFSYIAAIALLLVAISRLTKRMEDGPRGPAGMGTIMTFIASGALFAFADSIGSFSNSIFGDSVANINSGINPNIIADQADREKVQTVINALMGFVMLVGYIAFIRGWFVLKSFADGSQSATLAQGLTFLFGGTIAINLGELINVLQNTVGIGGNLTFT